MHPARQVELVAIGKLPDLHRIRQVPGDHSQSIDDLDGARRAVDVERFGPPGVGNRVQQARQPGDVVGMQVAQANRAQAPESPVETPDLDLGALAAIEQHQLAAGTGHQAGERSIRQGHHRAGSEQQEIDHDTPSDRCAIHFDRLPGSPYNFARAHADALRHMTAAGRIDLAWLDSWLGP